MNTAFVFPGQGPQAPDMLREAAVRPGSREKVQLLIELLGGEPTDFRANEVASLSTVLCSALELDRLREQGIECSHAAGYSVGQWSAMYAAGMLTFEETMRLVFARAALMNESDAVRDGAMLAVIGLPTENVDEVCRKIAQEDFVGISNYNCLGQLTLGGTKRGIERAQAMLAEMQPRKLALLEVAGAWHCRLLDSAADRFARLLAKVDLKPPAFPVADNVTGELLPNDRQELLRTLAKHLSSPVRWEACVQRLARAGVERFIEVGYGDMLTKFGFFIDRKRQHLPSKRLP